MPTLYAKIGTEGPADVETLFCKPPVKGQKVLVRKTWWNRWLPMTITNITGESKKRLYHMQYG